MADVSQRFSGYTEHGVALPVRAYPQIPVLVLGMSLSSFLAISYLICVVFDLWFPEFAMRSAWEVLLPGFVWLTWKGFLIGLIDALGYGWFIALIFGPLFNYFSERMAR